MINELKQLLEEVTVTVTKTRGKQEITFSFGNVLTVKKKELSDEEIDNLAEKDEKYEQQAHAANAKHEIEQVSSKDEKELEEVKAIEVDNKTVEELIVDESNGQSAIPVETVEKVLERTPEQLERVSKLLNLGFIEKPEEKQFVRGGVGIGTTMILGCDATIFNNHYKNISEDIEKSRAMNNKPKVSFSDFQADKIEFPEPTILDAGMAPKKAVVEVVGDKTVEVEVVKAAPEPAPPVPSAPAPKAELSVEDNFSNLVKEYKEGGYNIDTMDIKDYPNHKAVEQMREYLKDNPLK